MLGVLALALLTREHGFSISSWRRYVTTRAEPSVGKTETLIGKPRWVRGDDWMNDLPEIIAQTVHTPSFPVVNTKIGLGQSMLAPLKTPARNLVLLFRLSTWGFLFGVDFGLSWMWWFDFMGLFFISYLLMWFVSGRDRLLSLWGAFFILFSPFFQFWSLHKAEMFIHMGTAVFCVHVILTSNRMKWLLLCGALLGWSFGCFVLHHIYPPFAVVLGYLALFLIVGLHTKFRLNGVRIAAFAIALVIAGVSLGVFAHDAKELIQVMNKTSYPGLRFSTGGDYGLRYLLSSHFLFAGYIKEWTSLGNICESASFFFWSPIILAAIVVAGNGKYVRRDPVVIALLCFIAICLVFMFAGFPAWLSRISFFSKVPGGRAIMGLGLAENFLCVRLIALNERRPMPGFLKRITIVSLFTFVMFVIGCYLKKQIPGLGLNLLTGAVLANAIVAFLILSPRLGPHMLAPAVILSVLYTIGFNPVVIGGSELLQRNNLSTEIVRIDQAMKKKSVWVTFGPGKGGAEDAETRALGNLYRMVGVRSLDGFQAQPEFALWRAFDPEQKWKGVYNQTAFIMFSPEVSKSIRFESPIVSHVTVFINPLDSVFWKIGVTHFLVVGEDTSLFDGSPRLTKLATLKDAGQSKHIYQLN
jgi:hypothetical protein